MSLKKVFNNNCRIVGLAGQKNTGKTNNLVSLIKEYRKTNNDTQIYAYGMPDSVMTYLAKINIIEISSLSHLIGKRDCILIVDEFQKLKLNDRRHKDELAEFIDYIYHNNAYVILASPNLREFNSIIGGVIERWLLKDIRVDLCVNGCQLKKIVKDYTGRYKELGAIEIPVNKLLLINEEKEIILNCKYVKEADNKKGQIKLF